MRNTGIGFEKEKSRHAMAGLFLPLQRLTSLRVLLFTRFEHPYEFRREPVGHSFAFARYIKATSLA